MWDILKEVVREMTADDWTALIMLPVMVFVILSVIACSPTETQGWIIPFVTILPK